MVCLSRPYPFKISKCRLSKNLLSPLLNTLSHMDLYKVKFLSLSKMKILNKQRLTKSINTMTKTTGDSNITFLNKFANSNGTKVI